jgi:hypothetical protein
MGGHIFPEDEAEEKKNAENYQVFFQRILGEFREN